MKKKKLISIIASAMLAALCAIGFAGCGEKGDKGDTGATGATGAAGRGIVSVVYNEEGNLVITYTDNTSEVIIVPAKADCEHANVKDYVVTKAATCMAEGEKIVICEDCAHVIIESIDKDATNHVTTGHTEDELEPTCSVNGYYKEICACGEVLADEVLQAEPDYYGAGARVVTYATCEDDGYITWTCQREVCTCEAGRVTIEEANRMNRLQAIGHGEYKWFNVSDPADNPCEDGYKQIYACTQCFTSNLEACKDCEDMIAVDTNEDSPLYGKSTNVVEGTGHTAKANWTVSVVPTLTTAGQITGACDDCGKATATIELPALNAVDYTKTSPVNNVCKTGTDNYAITVDAWSDNFDVKVAAKHLNKAGKWISVDEAVEESDVDIVYDNAPATCKDTSGKGGFECQNCYKDGSDTEHAMILVSLRGAHPSLDETANWTLVSDTPATCYAPGMIVRHCAECDKDVNFPQDQKAHEYADEPTLIYEPGTTNVIAVEFVCKNAGCNCVTNDCANDDTYHSEGDHILYIACNGTPVEIDRQKATCQAPGWIKYSYSYTDPELGEQTGYYDVPLRQLGHNINGVELDTTRVEIYEISELKAKLGADYSKITFFQNTVETCIQKDFASFMCTDCGNDGSDGGEKKGFFTIWVMGDHDYADDVDPIPATCTVGTQYFCEICEEYIEDKATILGHSLVIDEVASNFVTGALVFKCDREGCNHTENVQAVNVSEIQTVKATCIDDGERYITYNLPSAPNAAPIKKVLEVLKPVPGVHFYGDVEININAAWTVEALQEIFGEDYATKVTEFENLPATCSGAPGSVSFSCTVCCTEVNPDSGKLPELLINNVTKAHTLIYVGATCVVDGYDYCTVCEKKFDSDKPEAVAPGHEYRGAYNAEENEVTVTCANCLEVNEVIENAVPAFSTADWAETANKQTATCAAEGYIVYKYEVVYEDTIVYTAYHTVIIEKVVHVNNVPPTPVEWVQDGYTYTGYYCPNCDQVVVLSKTPVTAE